MPTPVALSQLVDLALGTPEVGAVNFNILHTLLHAMIQKLNIQDVKADVDEHDRELLSVNAIPRTVSAFSLDSGYNKTEDSFSEDNLSEKSSYAASKKSPYHQLEKQVSMLTKQMEELNKLPSNEILMGKMNTKESERPISDMWQYMQLKKRVDANEEGIGKLMSLVEDLMKEMKDLKEAQNALMDKVNGINFDDIYSKLNMLDSQLKDLEKSMDDKLKAMDDKYDSLNDKLSNVPNMEDLDQYFSQFVTWPGLEDALKGIRLDFESLQPIAEERVVIELGTQTETPGVARDKASSSDKVNDIHASDKDATLEKVTDEPKSRPTSSRAASRASSARSQRSSAGPSAELLDILEKLGMLAASHEKLRQRVEELERLMELKANKSDLEGIGISEDLISTLRNLQDELKALQEGQLRDGENDSKDKNSFVEPEASPFSLRENPHLKADENDPKNLCPLGPQSVTLKNSLTKNELQESDSLHLLSDSNQAHDRRNIPMSLSNGQGECLSLHSISPEDLVSRPTLESPPSTTPPPLLSPVPQSLFLASAVNSFDKQDEASIKRLQEALQKLQNDITKLSDTLEAVVDENVQRVKQIQDLTNYCDRLDKKKADKEYVDMEVDVKADRRQLEGKVNHSLFDSTTNELNKLIKDILDKLNGHEGDWKSALAKAMEELDGKLDRLELSNLKDWLEKQLKSLNNKIKSMGSGGWNLDDEAAGMKKQLIQRFNCLSCDKPMDVMPQQPIASIPANYGLPKSKSPRPYTTFELDQIRQHARRHDRCLPFSTELAQRRNLLEPIERARTSTSSRDLGVNPEIADYYAQLRQCGGTHTLTQPHKRATKLNHLGQLFREEETILPLYKEEVDVQGADGHIYKGRMDSGRLEAKLPTNLTTQHSHPIYMQERGQSPKPPTKPISARVPRPTSARLGTPSPQNHVPKNLLTHTDDSVPAPHNSQIGGSRATTPHQEDGEVDIVAGENEPTIETQEQQTVHQEEVKIDVQHVDEVY